MEKKMEAGMESKVPRVVSSVVSVEIMLVGHLWRAGLSNETTILELVMRKPIGRWPK